MEEETKNEVAPMGNKKGMIKQSLKMFVKKERDEGN